MYVHMKCIQLRFQKNMCLGYIRNAEHIHRYSDSEPYCDPNDDCVTLCTPTAGVPAEQSFNTEATQTSL